MSDIDRPIEGFFIFGEKMKGALLIPNDDRLLVVNIALAEEIGLEESLMLLRLDFLIKIASGDVFKESTKFTYQSSRDLQKKYFPFWSYKTVQRVLTALEDSNLVYRSKKNYNKHKYDKTIWYSINYKEIDKLSSLKVDWDVVEANKKLSEALGQIGPRKSQNGPSLGQNGPRKSQIVPTIPGENTGEYTGEISSNSVSLRDKVTGRVLTNKTVQTLVRDVFITKDKNILESLKLKVQDEIKNGTPSQKVFWNLHNSFSSQKGYNLFSDKLKIDLPDGTKALGLFSEYEVDEKDFVDFYIKKWEENKSKGRTWYPTWGRIISTLNEYMDKRKEVKQPKTVNKNDWNERARKKV